MRELLSYSKETHGANPGAEEETKKLNEKEAKANAEEREAKALAEKKRALAAGDVSEYVAPQIQEHPAFLANNSQAQARMDTIYSDLNRMRSGYYPTMPVAAREELKGREIREMTTREQAQALVVETPDSVHQRYVDLTQQALENKDFNRDSDKSIESSVSSIAKLPEIAQRPDLTSMSDEDVKSWKAHRADILSMTDRLRRAPDVPPYNLTEAGLQTVLEKIGSLRAKSRELSLSPPRQPDSQPDPAAEKPAAEPTIDIGQ